jgi:hypothetical protein
VAAVLRCLVSGRSIWVSSTPDDGLFIHSSQSNAVFMLPVSISIFPFGDRGVVFEEQPAPSLIKAGRLAARDAHLA